MMQKEIYVVKMCGGSYEDYYETNIFVTFNKNTAEKYIKKFNSILKKWKDYYRQYTDKEHGFEFIKDEHIRYFDRWNKLKNIFEVYYEKIELR